MKIKSEGSVVISSSTFAEYGDEDVLSSANNYIAAVCERELSKTGQNNAVIFTENSKVYSLYSYK